MVLSVLAAGVIGMAGVELGEGTPVEGEGVTGRVVRHESVAGEGLAPRHVDVWLPRGYGENPERRYPVVYMHDGQNLFDPATSYIGVDWGVDEAMTRLIEAGEVEPAIVVGIWNTPKRGPEYMPEAIARAMPEPEDERARRYLAGEQLGDEYVAFVADQLKPAIDAAYRTRPDAAGTFTMGSSMGGLISMYLICERPGVFGGAGCVSTHWPAVMPAAEGYLREHAPDPETHRIYFDHGTETLDAEYGPHQARIDALVGELGYGEERGNLLCRAFEGDEHSERAWRRRVDVPLRFLLGECPPGGEEREGGGAP